MGGDSVQVRLAQVPEALVEDLRGVPGVRAVARTEQGLTLMADRAEEAIARIAAIAGKHGAAVEAMSYARPSLDDVFLQATGRSLRDEQGPDERAQRAIRRVRR
jgi:ABC-2 type transport system ATP-binding protein